MFALQIWFEDSKQWKMVEQVFELHCKRLALNERRHIGRRDSSHRPTPQETWFKL